MRKLLPIFIIILLVGVFAPPAVHAQAQPSNSDVGDCILPEVPNPMPNITRGECIEGLHGSFNVYSATNPAPTNPDTALTEAGKKAAAEALNTKTEAGCSPVEPWTWPNCIGAAVAYMVLSIMALLIWLAGIILNFVLDYTVVNMSQHIASFSGINTAWKVIRDLLNIGFIFLLIWEGIKLIASATNNANVRSFVIGIVITAVLVNFSLFITKIMIDASNIVTIGFYQSIIDNQQTLETPTGAVVGTLDKINAGLSVPFMKATGLAGLYAKNSLDTLVKQSGGGINVIIIGLAGSILFLIMAFVFLAVAVMFIVRYIILLVLLMLSPIAFVWKDTVPGLKDVKNQWWSSLKGQLFFGPIYMLLTWVVLTLMASPGFISQSGSWVSLFTGTGGGAAAPGSISLLFNYAIIVGLAIASLIMAKQYANQGSKMIGEFMGKVTAFAGDTVLGGAAKGLRNTVGRAGLAISESETLKSAAAKGGFTGFAAKHAMSFGEKGAKSTFDVRAGALSSTFAQAGAGKVDKKKQNFKAEMEAKVKEEEEFTKKLAPSEAAADQKKDSEARKAGDFKSYKDLQDKEKAAKKKRDYTNQNLADITKRAKNLREKANTEPNSGQRERMKQEADNLEKQIKVETGNLEKSETEWEKILDAEKKIDKEVESIFEERKEAYAKTFIDETEGLANIWRYTKNTAKFLTGKGQPLSKANMQQIAKKISNTIKDKTDDEKLIDLMAKRERKARQERIAGGTASDEDRKIEDALKESGEEKKEDTGEKKPEEKT